MMSASEGDMEKRSKGGCVNFIVSVPNADMGEGVKKSEIYVDIINGSLLMHEIQKRDNNI